MHDTCAIITFVFFDYCQSQKVFLCSYQLSLFKISSMAPINLVIMSICFIWASCMFSITLAILSPWSVTVSWLFQFHFLWQGSVGSSFSFSWACSPFHCLLNCLKCRQEQKKECLMKILVGLLGSLVWALRNSSRNIAKRDDIALWALLLFPRSVETFKWNHCSVFGSNLYTPCICPLNNTFFFCIFHILAGLYFVFNSLMILTQCFRVCLLFSLSWYDTHKFANKL